MQFSKNLVVCSSAGPKILAFGSHCSANFQPILDCFIPTFKLKYEDSENIKAGLVSTVVFNLRQIKRRACFVGHPVGPYSYQIFIKIIIKRLNGLFGSKHSTLTYHKRFLVSSWSKIHQAGRNLTLVLYMEYFDHLFYRGGGGGGAKSLPV